MFFLKQSLCWYSFATCFCGGVECSSADLEQAQSEKARLEERQRYDRRLRNEVAERRAKAQREQEEEGYD